MIKLVRQILAYSTLLFFIIKRIIWGMASAVQLLQRVNKTALVLILKKHGASIGENCDIETGIIFHNCKDFTNLVVGNNCHIGKNCFFDLRDKVCIQNNVVISMQCTFISHLDMNKSILRENYPAVTGPILIEDNAYIGARSTVLKNVTIAKESVVAACSLVVNNTNKGGVFGGVPAKFIKSIG